MTRQRTSTAMVSPAAADERYWVDRQQGLLTQLAQRQQGAQRGMVLPARPELEPADERTWWGGRRYSPTVKAHNRRSVESHLTAVRADYAQAAIVGLEYRGLARGLQTVAAVEGVYQRYAVPGSLCEAVGGAMLLDSVERIQSGISAINTRAREQIIANL